MSTPHRLTFFEPRDYRVVFVDTKKARKNTALNFLKFYSFTLISLLPIKFGSASYSPLKGRRATSLALLIADARSL